MPRLFALLRLALVTCWGLGSLSVGALGCSNAAGHAESAASYEATVPGDYDAPDEAPPTPAAPEEGYGYDYNEAGPRGLGGTDLAQIPKRALGTPSAPPASPTQVESGAGESGAKPPTGPSTPARRPLLIYDAELTLAVFETNKVIDQIEALARERHGYLVQRSDTSIRVRIPTDSFSATFDSIAALGDELHRQVQVRDVTEEFADIEARLRALRAVQERLEALLSKAANTSEALAIERELQRVTGEIESMLGRLKVLSELVAFSTITVSFEPRPVDKLGREHRLPFPWLGQLGLSNLLTLD
jgi:Domain of unknown function (DUF4349)